MATVARPQPLVHQLPAPAPYIVKENSTLAKVLSCIPILGVIPSVIQEISLHEKIQLSDDAPRLIELIKVKNEYKLMNIIRTVIVIALVVTAVAFGILSKGLAVVSLILMGFKIGNISMAYAHNKAMIVELEREGFRPGKLFT